MKETHSRLREENYSSFWNIFDLSNQLNVGNTEAAYFLPIVDNNIEKDLDSHSFHISDMKMT